MDHLSSLDASFLHLETPEMPMHVGSLMLFDLPPGYQGDFYEDVKAMIGSRLHLSPIFTRKLATMPFELAEPVWIEDDDIDLDYHVRSVALRRPGDMRQLHQLVARLHSSLLDRSRPMWEMVVIEGLENGQVAFYTKAHHAGVDGKAGAEMAKVLYDTSPQMRRVRPPPRRKASGGYQLGVAELLQAAVAHSIEKYRRLGEMLPAAAKAIGAAGRVLASQRTGGRPLNRGLAPKTLFNVSITNQRSYSTMSVSLSDLKATGRRVGGTVNTIVMAMCSGALRRFLMERDALPKEGLIAMVPVALRAAGDATMNNQVSMFRVDLATDIADLPERFKAIHASSEAAKAVVRELRPALTFDLPILGAPWLMTSMASMYGRSDLPSRMPPVGNVAISNVPGPQATLYMAGARMAHFYPVSIPAHGQALNITVQSYGDSLEFALTACRRALSQDESYELLGGLRDALAEIERLPSVDGGAAPEAPARADQVRSGSGKVPSKAPSKALIARAKPARARPGGGAERAAAARLSRQTIGDTRKG